MNITVDVKYTPRHDFKPDVGAIESLIAVWVRAALDDGAEDTEPFSFSVRIIRITKKARGFYGVKVRNRLDDLRLEVMVRPTGSDLAYICHVTCPDTDVSRAITSCYRPEVDECGNELCNGQTNDEVEIIEPVDPPAPVREHDHVPRRLTRAVRELCNNTNLPVISCAIRCHLRDTGRGTISVNEVVTIVFRSVLEREIDDGLACHMLVGFIESGILKPSLKGTDKGQLLPTKQLTEKANKFQLRVQQEECRKIDVKISSNQQLLATSEHEVARLKEVYEKKVAEQRDSQKRLQAKIAVLNAERASVPLDYPLFDD